MNQALDAQQPNPPRNDPNGPGASSTTEAFSAKTSCAALRSVMDRLPLALKQDDTWLAISQIGPIAQGSHDFLLMRLKSLREEFSPHADALFAHCEALPGLSRSMVVDYAQKAAEQFADSCLSIVDDLAELVLTDAPESTAIHSLALAASLALDSLTELYRWNSLSYRATSPKTRKAVLDCHLAVRQLSSWETGKAAHLWATSNVAGKFLFCRLLEHVAMGMMQQSEIIRLCLALPAELAKIELLSEPAGEESHLSIDLETGQITLYAGNKSANGDALYIRQGAASVLCTQLSGCLDSGALSEERRARWADNLAGSLGMAASTHPRNQPRVGAGHACRMLIGLPAILREVRTPSGRAESLLAAILDSSPNGCQLSLRENYYQRPAVGQLVLMMCDGNAPRVGVIRWVASPTGPQRSILGLEFVGTSPTVVPARKSSQWSSGLFVENVLCVQAAATHPALPHSERTTRLIVQKGSTTLLDQLLIGSDGRTLSISRVLESGSDFDVVSCCEAASTPPRSS